MSQNPYGNQYSQNSGYYPPPQQQGQPYGGGNAYPPPPQQQQQQYGGYPPQNQQHNNSGYPPPPQQGGNYNSGYPAQPQYQQQPSYGNNSYPPQQSSAYPPPPGPPSGQSTGNYPGNTGGYYPPGGSSAVPPPTQNAAGFPMSQPYSANPPNAYPQYPSAPHQGPPAPAYGQPPHNASNYSRPPPQGPPMGGTFNQGPQYGGNMYGSAYTAHQANQDAQALRSAMKGFGTDEKAIINIVAQRTPEQIATLSQAFKANYGKSLGEEFRSETSGDFGYLLQGFAFPQPEFECRCIHNCIAGLGTDEDTLIELIVGRTNSEMNNLKQCYRYMYNRDLEREIAHDTSRDFKRLLVALLQGGRDESQQVYDTSADVEALYRAGEKRFGTDEAAFISILCSRSETHLAQVFSQYQIKYGKPIQKVIKSEFSGDIERGLLNVVGYVQNRYEWAADQFEESMRGFGTREEKLSRLTIRFRHPHTMPHVKQAYQRKYGKSLYNRIHGETSGDYRALLLASVGQ